MENGLNLINHRFILKLLTAKNLLYHQRFMGKLNSTFAKRLTFFVAYPAFCFRTYPFFSKQNIISVFRVRVKNNNSSWRNPIYIQRTCMIYYFEVFGFAGHCDCNTFYSSITVGKGVSQYLFCQI